MFKVKVYKVYLKNNSDLWYQIEAPCKWVAKWCGAAILNTSYGGAEFTGKDMVAERYV